MTKTASIRLKACQLHKALLNVMEDFYPSRIRPFPELHSRQEPVVYSSEKPGRILSTKQKDSFEKRGFLVLNNLFSENEVATFQQELHHIRANEQIRHSDRAVTEVENDELRSVFGVHTHNEVFKYLSQDSRLMDITEDILADDVYIHQSRVNYKPGLKGKSFYWHSDFETWHVEDGIPRMRTISISVILSKNKPTNGPLMVIPGSHKHFVACVGETPDDHYKTSLKKQEYGIPDEKSLKYLYDQGGIEQLIGPAGTVIVFDSNLMHGSANNITPDPRSNVFMVYNSLKNRVVKPFGNTQPRPEYIASRDTIARLKRNQEIAIAG